MPYTVTMERAIFVARSRSLLAPVVMSSQNSSSAVRPPKSTAIWSSMPSRVSRKWSSSGSCMV